jgi:DNA topoisomerase VI subunit B
MTAPALVRVIFTTSRLAEFCSQKALTTQIGHDVNDWPQVVFKELVDNALDACEGAEIALEISIAVTEDSITITDNGPGIAPETIAKIPNFNVRVSSNEAYVSPTRGAQGNALKTIVAMGFALDGERGETIVESRGIKHRIVFTVDPIRQEPDLGHEKEASDVKIGTRITVMWPVSASWLLDEELGRFLQTAENYITTNPHLTLSFSWKRGDEETKWTNPATDPTWRKWKPSDPTSPHWYDDARLGRLIGAHIADDQDNPDMAPKTLGGFIREFRGLTGTGKAKEICEALGATRQTLAEFFGAGRIDRVGELLDEMRGASKPVNASDLGVIGRDHILAHFEPYGLEPATFKYKRAKIVHGDIPYLVEVAFGWCPQIRQRRIFRGLNWSAAIGDPFGSIGFGDQSLGEVLRHYEAGPYEPIAIFVHLACPRFEFRDHGKSNVKLPGAVAAQIVDLLKAVTAKWTKQRRAEKKHAAAEARRRDQLIKSDKPTPRRDAAWDVMKDAYLAASGNGKLPTKPRQIMYRARPRVIELAGKWYKSDQHFTQIVLVNYMAAHPDECADWDIVWDDRGHFVEPHTGRKIGLGTLAVRGYVADYHTPRFMQAGFAGADIKTCGPDGRFGRVLYCEKEGFDPLIAHAQLAEKFDFGFMSCKGQSVTAARKLADETCARYGIPFFILHDLDISGFSMAHNLHNSNRRYQFKTSFPVIDLGLRLADVQRLGLATEIVLFSDKKDLDVTRETLRSHGATPDEIEFLTTCPDAERPAGVTGPCGRRVELNALASDQFVEFIKTKMNEHGVKKVVPSEERLVKAYRMFEREERIRATVEEALAEREDEDDAAVPDDLEERVNAYLAKNPTEPWEEAVRYLSSQNDE